jgi:hypothetical protein
VVAGAKAVADATTAAKQKAVFILIVFPPLDCVCGGCCAVSLRGRSNTNVTHVCVSFFNFPALELNSSITTPFHVYSLAVVIERVCLSDRQSCLQIVGVLIKCCHELAERKKRLTCFPVALVTPLVLCAVRVQIHVASNCNTSYSNGVQ